MNAQILDSDAFRITLGQTQENLYMEITNKHWNEIYGFYLTHYEAQRLIDMLVIAKHDAEENDNEKTI